MSMCRGYEATESNVHALCCALYHYGDIGQEIRKNAELRESFTAAGELDHWNSSHTHVFDQMMKHYVDDKFARVHLLNNLKQDGLGYTASVLADMMHHMDFINRIGEVGHGQAEKERGPVHPNNKRRFLFSHNQNDLTEMNEESRLLAHSKELSDMLSGLERDAGFVASAAIGYGLIVA